MAPIFSFEQPMLPIDADEVPQLPALRNLEQPRTIDELGTLNQARTDLSRMYENMLRQYMNPPQPSGAEALAQGLHRAALVFNAAIQSSIPGSGQGQINRDLLQQNLARERMQEQMRNQMILSGLGRFGAPQQAQAQAQGMTPYQAASIYLQGKRLKLEKRRDDRKWRLERKKQRQAVDEADVGKMDDNQLMLRLTNINQELAVLSTDPLAAEIGPGHPNYNQLQETIRSLKSSRRVIVDELRKRNLDVSTPDLGPVYRGLGAYENSDTNRVPRTATSPGRRFRIVDVERME